MPLPPIRAYHAIITAYGFWLPNDPRGSWSDWIRQWEEILAAIAYVENNPPKEEKPQQRWSFVTAF